LTVHNVKDAVPIVDIFDKNKAQYNPDGSHNVRNDVAGMTIGAVAGAAAGGATGTFIAGHAGATIGAGVGAIVGAGVGAAAGEIAEHRK